MSGFCLVHSETLTELSLRHSCVVMTVCVSHFRVGSQTSSPVWGPENSGSGFHYVYIFSSILSLSHPLTTAPQRDAVPTVLHCEGDVGPVWVLFLTSLLHHCNWWNIHLLLQGGRRTVWLVRLLLQGDPYGQYLLISNILAPWKGKFGGEKHKDDLYFQYLTFEMGQRQSCAGSEALASVWVRSAWKAVGHQTNCFSKKKKKKREAAKTIRANNIPVVS